MGIEHGGWDEQDGEPSCQMLKVVNVLDCAPGHADEASSGLPIAILSLGFDGQVEQPLMLRLSDVRKLSVGLLRVLAHHGDRPAGEVLETHLTDDWRKQGSEQIAPVSRRQNVGGLEPTGMVLRLRHSPTADPILHETYGGYFDGQTRVVLYRYVEHLPNFSPQAHDTALLVGNPHTVQCWGLTSDEFMPVSDWKRFGQLPDNAQFRIGSRSWRKMSCQRLRELVGGKVFSIGPIR